jgi:hypothetical protein
MEKMMDLESIKGKIGLPNQSGFKQLIYNTLSQTLVVELDVFPQANNLPLTRLYYRSINSKSYKLIGNPTSSTSFRNPITSPISPTLIFSAWNVSGTFEKICSYDFLKDEITDLILHSDIVPPLKYKRCWVSSLLNFDINTTKIDIILAIEVQESWLSTAVSYYLSEMNWQNKSITILTKLEAVFY